MKDLMHLNRKQVLLNIYVWSIILTLFTIVDPIPGKWSAKIFGTILIYSNYVLAYYALRLFILPKLFFKKRIYIILGFIVSFIVYFVNSYFIYFELLNKLGGYSNYENIPFAVFFNFTFVYFSIIASASYADFYSQYCLYKIKVQAQKEKFLIEKELFFFRNEFNINTTFNFLNYCYKETLQISEETAQSVNLFTNLLNYTLKAIPEEKVTLTEEINNIQNYVKLQKLLKANAYVTIKYDQELNNIHISPRILMTFVENAFKHGIYNNPSIPIEIELATENTTLLFFIKNKISRRDTIKSTHVGLTNAKQILELNYSSNYTLSINTTNDFYTVALILNRSVL
jgi:hypothetical protein